MTDIEKNAISRGRGFDRRGDGVTGAWRCTCEWAVSRHGDECPEHGTPGVPIPDPLDDVTAERDRLAARVRELEAALRPFAYQARCLAGPPPDEPPVDAAEHFRFRSSYAAISAGDCRRAAEVLNRPPEEPDNG